MNNHSGHTHSLGMDNHSVDKYSAWTSGTTTTGEPYYQSDLNQYLLPPIPPGWQLCDGNIFKINYPEETEEDMEGTLRKVKIFIVDEDENVPLKDRILFETKEIVTDLSDDDLLYENVDFKAILKGHNDERAKLLDEEKSEKRDKDIFLKPIKKSDLTIKIQNLVVFD